MNHYQVSQKIKELKKPGEFFSLFPHDSSFCDCVDKRLVELAKFEMQKMSKQQREHFIQKHNGKWDCPRSKEPGMKEYEIFCKNCGDKVGEVHSIDKKMTDWCNFHYYNNHNADSWHGCITANAVNGILTIECACGEDTRDFSKTKKYENYLQIESKNKIGREWGNINSKFNLKLKGK